MSQTLFLGVDGGGTKCKVRLETADGKFLGEGLSGPANPVQSFSGACREIEKAAQQALGQANLPPSTIGNIHAGLGLAGVNVPSYKEKMSHWAHPFASAFITSDMHIACLGAHGGKDGAVMITGTGFNAGSISNGQYKEFGGYGFTLADKPGGARIGACAISLALECLDGLVHDSPFIQAILTKLARQDAISIIEKTLNWTPKMYAQFAPLAFQYAQENDKHAKQIVQQAADHVNKVGQVLMQTGTSKISMIGGIAVPINPWLENRLRDALSSPKHPPESGALLYARQQLTISNEL